jgi:hypothetical protein
MGPVRTTRPLLLTCAAGAGVAAGVAHASNNTHLRTPVVWDGEALCGTQDADVACGVIVDRSQGTTWHFPYGIPSEDTEVTMDEVPDSRRHQFFAFCRARAPLLDRLPGWITQADVDAAAEVIACTTPMDEGPDECAPLVDPSDVSPDDVLETAADWQGCFFRVTADDARRPITCEMAQMGIDWATDAVPVGVYAIEGYTWEPAFNLWSPRPGFVKIVDDPSDAVQDRPAAAILVEGDGLIETGDPVELPACVDALPGSTLHAEWALAPEGDEDPVWHEIAPAAPVDDGPTVIELDPPEEAEGKFIVVRATVEDPMGRSWIAYTQKELGVLPGTDCPDEGGGIVVDPDCEDGGSSESDGGSSEGSGGSGTEAGAADDGDGGSAGGGCGCHAPAPAVFSGVWLLGWRRRARRAYAAACADPSSSR